MCIRDSQYSDDESPHILGEIDDKNITTRSMTLKFILYYSSKNLFLAFLIAFKTFFGAVPP